MRLAKLLHYANSSPPLSQRREFYALKDRLLSKYGTPDGNDVQHIEGKICYGCDGTGEGDAHWADEYDGYDDDCHRCGGSGWWKPPKWIVLNRYRWGGFCFHIPGEVTYTKPEPDVTRIHGYVEHRSYGRKSDTAFATLCLLTGEWRMLWQWLRGQRACGWQWHPWLVLQQIVCTVCWKLRDWRARCNTCGRHTWGSTTFVCRSCQQVSRQVAMALHGDDDAPF